MRIEKNLSQTLQKLFASSKESMGNLLGAWKSAISGQGLEVKEIRPFSPGDNPLSAVWSRFAQTGTLYSKIFQEERDRTIYIALDHSGSMFQGKGKQAHFSEELFSYLAWAACASNDKVGGIFNHNNGIKVAKPKSGRFQAEVLIQEALQTPALPSTASLAHFFQKEGSKELKRSLLFYISDFIEPLIDWKSLFLQLSHTHEVVLIQITNLQEEAQLIKAVGLSFFDPEVLPFEAHIIKQRDLTARNIQQKVEMARVQKAAESAKCTFFSMATEKNCLEQLLELLEKKRKGQQ